MFKENNQLDLYSFENELPEVVRKRLDRTQEKSFYNLVFRNINERDYKALFSDKASRPNVPVNILVGSLILKERKGWSFDELMEQIMFDLRTKYALGLTSLEEMPFSRATLFNFQDRVQEYETETGINLIELTFDRLTAGQLAELKIKTNIQRTDSTLISANIRRYGRVQLLVETLLRLFRKLEKTDKEQLSTTIEPYSKQGSEKYIYSLNPDDLPHELEKLGKLYHTVLEEVKDKYSETPELKMLDRVYKEHFTVVEGNATAKANEELGSSILQSPDDEDATFRKKRKEESRGYTINATETAHPDNEVQLLIDVAVNKNNIDDSAILEKRIDRITEKTPDLEEIHTDGGYGSQAFDKKMAEKTITQITTAVRGKKKSVETIIEQSCDNGHKYTVKCPLQTIYSEKTKTRYKAIFDADKCKGCLFKVECSINKNNGRYYFTHSDYLKNERGRNILKIPPDRRKLRPNVEAAMREFKTKTRAGKLKVRGMFKTSLFAYLMAISINFGRIYRLNSQNDNFFYTLLLYFERLASRISFIFFSRRNKEYKLKWA